MRSGRLINTVVGVAACRSFWPSHRPGVAAAQRPHSRRTRRIKEQKPDLARAADRVLPDKAGAPAGDEISRGPDAPGVCATDREDVGRRPAKPSWESPYLSRARRRILPCNALQLISSEISRGDDSPGIIAA